MRALLKIGASLLVLAFILIGASYSMLRAQGTNGPSSPGSRLVATERRTLEKAVAKVDLSGPVNLTLRQGAVPSLEVRGEQRLLANIDTSVDGDVLHIGPRGILLRHRTPIEVILTLPQLESLSVTGNGDHTVSGFAGDQLDVALDGSGSMRFNGRYRAITAAVHGSGDLELTGGSSDAVNAAVIGSGRLTLVGASRALSAELRGAGDLDARHLRADEVDLMQEGAGDAAVYARKRLHAQLTGNGDARVYGNPDAHSVTREGTGSVTFED
jgi:Putative auto-transporter adhesin, head GIN domain